MVFQLYALTLASIAARGEEFSGQTWRSAENGGVNVLYCYLRINGVTCEYAELLEELSRSGTGNYSALTLAKAATRNAFPMRTAALTMDDLRSCALPIIVHMDGETPDVGTFLLLTGITENVVYYVNGPCASIRVMYLHDFRRIWSGFALVPTTRRNVNAILWILGFGLGLGLSAAIQILCSKRSQ